MRSPIRYPVFVLAYLVAALLGSPASAQSAKLSGSVTDETGGALPGVLVQLLEGDNRPAEATTDAGGHYAFDKVAPGPRDLVFGLINFARVRRQVQVPQSGELRVRSTCHLAPT